MLRKGRGPAAQSVRPYNGGRRGVVGIRVLAGGALSGSTDRHPIARPPPEPIGSAVSYEADVARARRLLPLVKEGFAESLTEAATRFAISHPAMGTILVGMAAPHQFEDALAAVQKGPLPSAALDRLAGLQQTFAGELACAALSRACVALSGFGQGIGEQPSGPDRPNVSASAPRPHRSGTR
jgi:hypothetical protein